MSKSNPSTPKTQVSILNFFSKTPSTSKSLAKPVESAQKSKQKSQVSPSENEAPEEQRKRTTSVVLSEDSPTTPPSRKSKRRRIVLSDEDDEDYTPMEVDATPKNLTKPTTPISSGARRHRIMMVESDEEAATPKLTPTSKRVGSLAKPVPRTPKTPTTPRTPARSNILERFDELNQESSSNAPKSPSRSAAKPVMEFNDAEQYLHETFEWLKPENIRDAKKRPPDHPEYDPQTLFVPEFFLKEQTPGHQQFWRFKQTHFDTVLFFKVGKFYEMYHMDAAIGIQALDLTAMRGNYAHCGFPEMAYGKYSDMLISRGYKVARIEQTETPDMLKARNDTSKVKDKVVRREICRITSVATKTYGVYDGSDRRDYILSLDPSSNYLMVVVEEELQEKRSSYGVCFIDTSIGQFILGQFEDDICRSSFRTLVAQYQPSQVIFPKGRISNGTQAIFNSTLSAVKKEPLSWQRDFLPEDKVVSNLMKDEYLGNDLDSWPPGLASILDLTLHVPRPLEKKELAVRALGGMMVYLQRCLIDVDMFSLKRFEEYLPHVAGETGVNAKPSKTGAERWKGQHLVIDGATLLNLHLVPPYTGKKASSQLRDATALKFSLFSTVDHCRTPFGKRCLRQWICAPSCDPNIIMKRQDAVEFLMGEEAIRLQKKSGELFKKMPDLERLLQKIHTLGLKYRSEQHPDSRAQMFCPLNYNKRKIRDLVAALEGFESIAKLVTFYREAEIEKCDLVDKCLGDTFPSIHDDLEHFKKAFDRQQALQTGEIVPRRGIDKMYDQALKRVDECEKACEKFAEKQRNRFGSRQISLFGSGKTRYLLEFPDNVAAKLGREFELKSKRKGFKRYGTEELVELTQELLKAEADRDAISTDATRRVFEDFADRKDKWNRVVDLIATYDCLCSLASFANNCLDLCFPICRPSFDFDAEEPRLCIKKGYHPLLLTPKTKLAKAPKFVPNDTEFGKQTHATAPMTVLLTGPNMGGKSTLMRQVGVLVVLAQMGALVPATAMNLTPVDRIFSRIGAHDCSYAGESTFFVELNETNSILKNATRDSFVIIDELGRGTSTNDGTAIAGAVLRELADKTRCRTFFSTHYFALCDLVEKNENVRLAHMSFIVENDNPEDALDDSVVFLYTLADGPCKRSYGFFAARLAGVPKKIVTEGNEAGQLLKQQQERTKLSQQRLNCLRELRSVCSTGSTAVDQLALLISAL